MGSTLTNGPCLSLDFHVIIGWPGCQISGDRGPQTTTPISAANRAEQFDCNPQQAIIIIEAIAIRPQMLEEVSYAFVRVLLPRLWEEV